MPDTTTAITLEATSPAAPREALLSRRTTAAKASLPGTSGQATAAAPKRSPRDAQSGTSKFSSSTSDAPLTPDSTTERSATPPPLDAERTILAERFKTKMCRNYERTGACPYVHRCMFAHGDHELRTVEMNLADGLTTEDAIAQFKRAVHANRYLRRRAMNLHMHASERSAYGGYDGMYGDFGYYGGGSGYTTPRPTSSPPPDGDHENGSTDNEASSLCPSPSCVAMTLSATGRPMWRHDPYAQYSGWHPLQVWAA
jgi:hypothetical protein